MAPTRALAYPAVLSLPSRPSSSPEPPLKARIVTGAMVWVILITLAHVQLNVGWSALADEIRVLLGMQRQSLIVGLLPVT